MYRAASNTSNAEINTPGQEFVVAAASKGRPYSKKKRRPVRKAAATKANGYILVP
jgi:hypothetical protein